MPEDTKTYRKMTVTSCDALKSGTSKNGNPWTMYEVYAVSEAGEPIEAKLRAFDQLPINELVEYGVTKRVDDRHGTSYTLELPKNRRPPRDTSKSYKSQIDALKLQVANLEQRTEWLLGLIHELQAGAGVELATEPATSGHQSAASAGAPAGGGSAALGQGQIPV